jgi:hypothetical protein
MKRSHDPRAECQNALRKPHRKIWQPMSQQRSRPESVDQKWFANKDGTAGGPFYMPLVPWIHVISVRSGIFCFTGDTTMSFTHTHIHPSGE